MFNGDFALNPLLVFALCAFFILLIQVLTPGWTLGLVQWIAAKRTWAGAAGGAAITLYLVVGLYYAFSPFIWDHGELAVAAGAKMYRSGHVLYNSIQDAERYSTLYGPATFMIYGCGMSVLGVSMGACKAVASAAAVANIGFCYLALRRVAPAGLSLFATGLGALLILGHNWAAFLCKADPFILALAAAALWCATGKPSWSAAILLGALIGVEADLKVHAFLYCLPALAVFAQKAGMKKGLLVTATSLIVFWLPFLLPGISFMNWWRLMRIEGGSGFDLALFVVSLQWEAVLCLPLLLLWTVRSADPEKSAHSGQDKWPPLVLGISMAAALVFASKRGSGPNHIMPFVPCAIYFALEKWREAQINERLGLGMSNFFRLGAVTFVVCAVLLGGSEAARMISIQAKNNPTARAVCEDVRQIIEQLPAKRICMGYGELNSVRFTFYKMPLLAVGNPELLNFSAMIGYHGFELSDASYALIESKAVDVWLIPKDNAPFSMPNRYAPYADVFGERFRKVFAGNYEKRGSSRFFDLYLKRS